MLSNIKYTETHVKHTLLVFGELDAYIYLDDNIVKVIDDILIGNTSIRNLPFNLKFYERYCVDTPVTKNIINAKKIPYGCKINKDIEFKNIENSFEPFKSIMRPYFTSCLY